MTSLSWRSAQLLCDRSTISVPALRNLVVEFDRRLEVEAPAGIEIAPPAIADGQTLAWIDQEFGGWWSSEANAGLNVTARRAGVPVGFATIDARGSKFAWLDGVARESGTGILGPVGVARELRGRGIGRALLARALDALRASGYARAVITAVSDDASIAYYESAAGARVAESFEREQLYRSGRRTLVMASGNGGNFQAVLDASRSGELPIEIVGLLANDEHAYAVERARLAKLESVSVISWDRRAQRRDAYDTKLLSAAQSRRPDLVLLLGWMHLLPDAFVRAFPQLLNLHPAFLPLDPRENEVGTPDGTKIPAFRGAHAVRDALAASSAWVGATLHRVTPDTDRGPVMTRVPLRVEKREDEARLMVRVHELEREVVRAGITRWLFER
jgi:phosphoribosylglycinamide formyltransferase 1